MMKEELANQDSRYKSTCNRSPISTTVVSGQLVVSVVSRYMYPDTRVPAQELNRHKLSIQ